MAEDDGSRMTSVDLCAMIAKGRCSGKLGPEAEGATGAGPFVCAGARPTSSQTHFTLGESGCFITSFLKTTPVGYRFSRQSKQAPCWAASHAPLSFPHPLCLHELGVVCGQQWVGQLGESKCRHLAHCQREVYHPGLLVRDLRVEDMEREGKRKGK